MAQLMPLPLTVSCFSKIQIGFTFLVLALPSIPWKRAFKRVCVCIYHIYLSYSHLPVLWNVKKLLHTDSKHLHHCCHLSNKIENIDCRPDIPYTLQWAGRCPPQNCPFHWGVWAFTIVPLVSDVHIPNVISVGGAIVAQLTVMFNTQTERQTDHATAVTIGRILCMQSDVA